nr:hypothetical protein [uncultured Rhodococcus sp.]
MTEPLVARSSEIAGLGNLLDRISVETLASHRYLLAHAGLSENVIGQILQRLQPHLASFQEMTRTRQVHLSANCGEMGAELIKAAWLYAD